MSKSLFRIICFASLYSLLVLFLGLPYYMTKTWGNKMNILEHILSVFFSTPFSISNKLYLIFINGIFWGVIFVFLLYLVKVIRNK